MQKLGPGCSGAAPAETDHSRLLLVFAGGANSNEIDVTRCICELNTNEGLMVQCSKCLVCPSVFLPKTAEKIYAAPFFVLPCAIHLVDLWGRCPRCHSSIPAHDTVILTLDKTDVATQPVHGAHGRSARRLPLLCLWSAKDAQGVSSAICA